MMHLNLNRAMMGLFLIGFATACSNDSKSNDTGDQEDTATDTADSGVVDTGDTGPSTGVEDVDGDGYSRDDGDCDDNDPDVYPGAPEIPQDGIDQDCDGFDAEPDAMSIEDVMPGMLIITEIMKNPDGVDDSVGEWFEVFNASPEFINLNGLKVMDDSGDSFTIVDDFILDGANYIVFTNGEDPFETEILNYEYDGSLFVLGNGADVIALANESTVIDIVQYDNGQYFPDSSGYSMSLDIRNYHDIDNDSGENWCNAIEPYSSDNYGSPGFDNPECPQTADDDGDGFDSNIDCDDSDPLINPEAQEIPYDGIDQNCDGQSDFDADGDGYDSDQYNGTDCDDSNSAIYPGGPDIPGDGIDQDCDGVDAETTPGVSTVADLNVGDLIITEIMNNPDAPIDDLDGEWIEIYNTSAQPIDILGLAISDQGQDMHLVLQSTVIQAGAYAVLGRNADTAVNGGVNIDYEYSNFNLSNADDEVILSKIDSSGAALTIDEVPYDGGLFFPSQTGASMSLSPLHMAHDVNNFGDNWCASTVEYGGSGNYGTPGTANHSCLNLSYVNDIEPIFASYGCLSCHASGHATLEVSYANIVGVPSVQSPTINLIETGNADLSYLYLKMMGIQSIVGGYGDMMPPGGGMDILDQNKVRDWINTGALP